MYSSPIDARDEMFGWFDDRWDTAVVPTILAEPCEVRWQGKEEGTIPEDYFVRISTQAAKTEGGGFMQNGQGSTPQVFDTYGLLFVQVFAPMAVEDSYRKGELLAIAARDIFRASETASGTWFRKARYVEVANDGKHYGWKVTVEYEFSEN
jgi:hypothetical protein